MAGRGSVAALQRCSVLFSENGETDVSWLVERRQRGWSLERSSERLETVLKVVDAVPDSQLLANPFKAHQLVRGQEQGARWRLAAGGWQATLEHYSLDSLFYYDMCRHRWNMSGRLVGMVHADINSNKGFAGTGEKKTLSTKLLCDGLRWPYMHTIEPT
jgi:hypothetical protein